MSERDRDRYVDRWIERKNERERKKEIKRERKKEVCVYEKEREIAKDYWVSST